MTIALSILSMLVAAFALYGWGNLMTIVVGHGQSQQKMPYLIVLGLSAICFLGGLLNAVNLAYGYALDVLTLIGLFSAVYFTYKTIVAQRNQEAHRYDNHSAMLPLFIVLAYSTWFLSFYLSPSSSFNFHDDLHTYLPRIPLMLETGNVGSNPLGLAGLDSLGAQAFLQSFVFRYFSVDHVVAFDAVFCLLLSLLLIIQLGLEMRKPAWSIFIALTSFVLINTQQVNISSVYATIALGLGLIIATIKALKRNENEPGHYLGGRKFLPVFLFLSALIAMKLLSAFFASFYFIVLFLIVGFHEPLKASVRLRQFVNQGLLLTLLTLPWLLTHAGKYSTALTSQGEPNNEAGNASGDLSIDFSLNIANVPFDNFLSSQELFWGGSFLAYNMLFAVFTLAAVITLIKHHGRIVSPIASAFCAVSLATAACYTLGWFTFEYGMALRYSLPLLALATPVFFLYLAPDHSHSARRLKLATLLIAHVFVLAGFTPSFAARIQDATQYRSILRFPTSKPYESYTKFAISEDARKQVAEAQSSVPEGSQVLAWISKPHHFDFKRNDIRYLAEPFFATPWFNMPLELKPDAFRSYLLESGFEYVIWEYKGRGMKSMRTYKDYLKRKSPLFQKLGRNSINMNNLLNTLAKSGERLHLKSGIVAFSLANPQE